MTASANIAEFFQEAKALATAVRVVVDLASSGEDYPWLEKREEWDV